MPTETGERKGKRHSLAGKPISDRPGVASLKDWPRGEMAAISPETGFRLETAAKLSGRSLGEEIEFRLRCSLEYVRPEDAPPEPPLDEGAAKHEGQVAGGLPHGVKRKPAAVCLDDRRMAWHPSLGSERASLGDRAAFKVVEPSGKTYSVFADGHAEGFERGAVICNYIPALLARASLGQVPLRTRWASWLRCFVIRRGTEIGVALIVLLAIGLALLLSVSRPL